MVNSILLLKIHICITAQTVLIKVRLLQAPAARLHSGFFRILVYKDLNYPFVGNPHTCIPLFHMFNQELNKLDILNILPFMLILKY